MSEAYDTYLREHVEAVRKAGRWMADNLAVVKNMPDEEVGDFLLALDLHDQSKHDPAEYVPYDDYFYGERDLDAFNVAWLHHIHHNAHHWQHWLLMQDDGKYREPGKVIALEMPRAYALEMVADWWSFSWRSGDLTEMFAWYRKHEECIVLHENTTRFVNAVLNEIRGRLLKQACDEVLPCPICGNRDLEVYANDWCGDSSIEDWTGVVECACGCMFETVEHFGNPIEAQIAAVKAWNRRAE